MMSSNSASFSPEGQGKCAVIVRVVNVLCVDKSIALPHFNLPVPAIDDTNERDGVKTDTSGPTLKMTTVTVHFFVPTYR